MASAAASVVQVEIPPPHTMPKKSQDQPSPREAHQAPGPLKDPGLNDDRREQGPRGWWGRRWRQPPPPVEGAIPADEGLPESSAAEQTRHLPGQRFPEHPADPSELPLPENRASQQTEGGGPHHPLAGRQGGRPGHPHFWRHDKRWMEGFPQDGRYPEGGPFGPWGSSGYYGYRHPCFMRGHFGAGPENSYIFREFDFM